MTDDENTGKHSAEESGGGYDTKAPLDSTNLSEYGSAAGKVASANTELKIESVPDKIDDVSDKIDTVSDKIDTVSAEIKTVSAEIKTVSAEIKTVSGKIEKTSSPSKRKMLKQDRSRLIANERKLRSRQTALERILDGRLDQESDLRSQLKKLRGGGGGDDGDEGQAKRLKKNEGAVIQWRQEKEKIYYLRHGKLFFVDRDNAIQQLQEWHQLNFEKGAEGGLTWYLPLADHIVLGKTTFASHYIRKCRDKWHNIADRSPFQKALCEAQTIIVRFSPGDLAQDGDWNTVVVARLKAAIRNRSEVPPKIILDKAYASPNDLLVDLVSFNGSVFVVLDEIGNAFESLGVNDLNRRELFLRFCDKILDPWLSKSKIFLLLVGRASFLSYVGRRPQFITGAECKHEYPRLSLHLLRPQVIATILKNTYVSLDEPVSLQEYFSILEDGVAGDGRPSLDTVAHHLFKTTMGHPRTLCEALISCLGSKDVMGYTEIPVKVCWDHWYRHFCQYRTHLVKIFQSMEREELIDLTNTITDAGSKVISLESISSNAWLAVEGEFTNAKLCAPKLIWDFWKLCQYTFRSYIQAMANIDPSMDISLHFADCWVSMLLRRFQEMFQQESNPAKVSPEFFGTEKFGNCELRLFSDAARMFPKITAHGKETVAPTLDDETAIPEAWPDLMAGVDTYELMCFRPRPMSSSPDAFAVSNAKLGGKVVRLCLMIAAKNFQPTTFFDTKAYNDELGKANRMFEGSSRVDRRLNVLVIAATNYRRYFKGRFNGTKFFSETNASYPHLHEIIFLDLSTAANRALFFGVDPHDALIGTIESVISKLQTTS